MAAPQAAEAESAPQSPPAATAKPSDPPISSSPVEMSDLTSRSANEEPSSQQDNNAGAEQPAPEEEPTSSQAQNTLSVPQDDSSKPAPKRQQSEVALGPATDGPIAVPAGGITGHVLSISLMLTTGTRHPYKIDERYLRNRKVDAIGADGDFDPREISGYKLKELIWTDWRPEWEPRPASPSAIRLIILGRLLDDKAALKDFPFKMDDINVVHMTVKPADFLDDDDGTGGKAGKSHSNRGRDGEERGAGCRCVIL